MDGVRRERRRGAAGDVGDDDAGRDDDAPDRSDEPDEEPDDEPDGGNHVDGDGAPVGRDDAARRAVCAAGRPVTLVVENARLFTMTDNALGVVDDGVVVCDGATITYAGPARGAPPATASTVIDASGRAVLPGLVDCHTHLIFAGTRVGEFALRARGASYAEIMAAGGGIRSTMKAVRAASEQQLVDEALPRLARMLRRGVTTVEIKSGYGLTVDDELKTLRAAKALRAAQPVDVVATLLAAHAVPPEHDAASWIDAIVADLLPVVAREGLASYCDVFVERGAFSVDDGRKLLRAAQGKGLGVRVHAEQLSRSGGALLAAELGAVAAGHLEHATAEDVDALAQAGVVAEVLATAQTFLGLTTRIPGRALADAGVVVAVATDCNPGSAMSTDLGLAAGLAVTQCGLRVEEALLGVTRNAAKALGLDDRGVLRAGARADLVVLATSEAADLAYRWGEDLADAVVVGGRRVHGP